MEAGRRDAFNAEFLPNQTMLQKPVQFTIGLKNSINRLIPILVENTFSELNAQTLIPFGERWKIVRSNRQHRMLGVRMSCGHADSLLVHQPSATWQIFVACFIGAFPSPQVYFSVSSARPMAHGLPNEEPAIAITTVDCIRSKKAQLEMFEDQSLPATSLFTVCGHWPSMLWTERAYQTIFGGAWNGDGKRIEVVHAASARCSVERFRI
eukprot:scaffold425_cov175-Amphora_coffeaeformis.AAC.78